MIEDNRNSVISEEYADLLVDLRANPGILELIPNATLQHIDLVFSVIHVPLSQITGATVIGMRMLQIPHIYGIDSEIGIEASGISELRDIPVYNLRGNGVLIGVVDTGINYSLPAFLKADGSTKIVSLWDQTIQSDEPAPFELNYGTIYNAEQINRALSSSNPLDIVPSTDEIGHGTMVAGVAAGTDNRDAGFAGVAPDAELIVVKLRQAKEYLKNYYSIPEDVPCFQENHIMQGVRYCVLAARQLNRPISLCIALGSSQGGHDGTTPLALQLSTLADSPRTGITVAVGNEGNKGRHFRGRIDPQIGNTVVELNVGEEDKGFFMEFWGDSPGIYSIDILSPSGEYIPRIVAGLQVRRTISFIFDETTIDIEIQTIQSLTGDELIFFNFHNTSPGVWRFTVYSQGNLPGGFHMWLPMDDFITTGTYFIQPDIYTTVLAPATAVIPISVTAYNPLSNTLFVSASRGFTRNNIVKPELAAPGVNYIAPAIDGGYTSFTGTSVAAAHTTGAVALGLEWGVIRGNNPNIDTQEIKKYLIRGARRSRNLTYPNRDWGYGMLDLFNTFDVLRSTM